MKGDDFIKMALPSRWVPVQIAIRRVTVYYFEKEVMEEYSFGEDVPVGIYEGFTIKAE